MIHHQNVWPNSVLLVVYSHGDNHLTVTQVCIHMWCRSFFLFFLWGSWTSQVGDHHITAHFQLSSSSDVRRHVWLLHTHTVSHTCCTWLQHILNSLYSYMYDLHSIACTIHYTSHKFNLPVAFNTSIAKFLNNDINNCINKLHCELYGYDTELMHHTRLSSYIPHMYPKACLFKIATVSSSAHCLRM